MRRKTRKRLKKSQIALIIIAAMVLLFLSIYIAFSVAYNKNIHADFKTINADENEDLLDEKKINVLILGLEHSRTDAIMVATYDTQIKRLDVMSLHRDTYVQSREQDYKDATLYKLNSLYSIPNEKDGVERIAREVSSITGIPINEFVMVDYEAVAKIVDAVGGVDVDLPFTMSYDDPYSKPATHIYIPKGSNHLDGETAVKYLRWRQNNGGIHGQEGDIGRVKRQQDFMKKLLDKAIDPTLLPKVIEVAFESVKTSVDFNSAVALGANAATMDTNDVHFYTQIGEGAYFYGLSYFVSDKESNRKLFQKIINGYEIAEADLTPSPYFYSQVKQKVATSGYRYVRSESGSGNSTSTNNSNIQTQEIQGTGNPGENEGIIFGNDPPPTNEQINNSVSENLNDNGDSSAPEGGQQPVEPSPVEPSQNPVFENTDPQPVAPPPPDTPPAPPAPADQITPQTPPSDGSPIF